MTNKTLIGKLQDQRKRIPAVKTGVVAVLAHKEEINNAMSQGFTMKEIHSIMVSDNAMPISYAAFTRLVKKYIKSEATPLPSSAKSIKPKKSHIYNPDDHDVKELY